VTCVGMDPARRLTERDLGRLRAVLNGWDPIGIRELPGAPGDEYDCLLWPLASRLDRGASRREIMEFLEHELAHHFGIVAVVPDQILDRVVTWWEARGSMGGASVAPR
jgi:hypothetical protein